MNFLLWFRPIGPNQTWPYLDINHLYMTRNWLVIIIWFAPGSAPRWHHRDRITQSGWYVHGASHARHDGSWGALGSHILASTNPWTFQWHPSHTPNQIHYSEDRYISLFVFSESFFSACRTIFSIHIWSFPINWPVKCIRLQFDFKIN